MKLWDRPGVPHKGWRCEDVDDVRGNGSSPNEADYEVCQMCGNERIRYVHVMSHPGFPERLNVGCICAEKMSGDYIGPKRRETKLRNLASRRKNWLTRKWRVSSKGNDFLNVDGKNVVVFPKKFKPGKWGYGIDGEFSREVFDTKEEAKLAAFDRLRDFANLTEKPEQRAANFH